MKNIKFLALALLILGGSAIVPATAETQLNPVKKEFHHLPPGKHPKKHFKKRDHKKHIRQWRKNKNR